MKHRSAIPVSPSVVSPYSSLVSVFQLATTRAAPPDSERVRARDDNHVRRAHPGTSTSGARATQPLAVTALLSDQGIPVGTLTDPETPPAGRSLATPTHFR